jgi:hypothetical protein
MTNYHTFREIHQHTPAAIIELGFMLADRALLTGQPELLGQAVNDAILCQIVLTEELDGLTVRLPD